MAAALGDTVGIRRAIANDSILENTPFYVVFYALDNAVDLRGTEGLYPRALARSATADERAAIMHALGSTAEVSDRDRARALQNVMLKRWAT